MRIAGLGVALALVAGGSGYASGQGLNGGPKTTKYAKRLLGELVPGNKRWPTTTLPLKDFPTGGPARPAPPAGRPKCPPMPGSRPTGNAPAAPQASPPARGTARGLIGTKPFLDLEPGRAHEGIRQTDCRTGKTTYLPDPRLNGSDRVGRPAPRDPYAHHGPAPHRAQIEEAQAKGGDALKTLADELGANPSALTPGDVEALKRAARSSQAKRDAAPELFDALDKVARGHPSAAVRRSAQRGVDRLAPTANAVELRRYAEQLKADGKKGVDIWSKVAEKSVDHHKSRSDITDAQKFDEVIADLTAVFNGPDAKRHLEKYERWTSWAGSDPHVDTMIRRLDDRDLAASFAGMGIDPTRGEDFQDRYNDGTKNQVYHTNFFVTLGYAAADDPLATQGVNLWHETVDPGQSVADFRASYSGIKRGQGFRAARDRGEGTAVLEQLPNVIRTFFGKR